MSFNVNYGGDRGKALRAIARSRADVVALQETTSDWPRLAKRALGKRYRTMLFFSSPGAGGMGFLSRYPVVRQRRLPARGGGWFQAWLLQLKTPLGQISFLNVHLRPPLGNDGRLSSIPSAYFATRSIRRRELQAHMHHIAPVATNRRSRLCGAKRRPKGCLPATVVLGDFNESRQGLALRWLRKKRGMISALHRFDKTSPTWSWPTRWWTFRSRLDHVMHSAHLHATSAKVLPAAGSDHFPLLVTLTRRPSAPR